MTSKITLSQAESELVHNAGWFFTKLSITEKVHLLFAELLEELRQILLQNPLFGKLELKSPKIFKGENYKGLPWVMLDYPRNFSTENIFAIRTMFWWANYFVITLHIRGEYKMKLINTNSFGLPVLQQHDFYIAIDSEEWEHHLENDNYLPAANIDDKHFAKIISDRPFLKIAKMLPLTEWDNAVIMIPTIYREMLSLFSNSIA